MNTARHHPPNSGAALICALLLVAVLTISASALWRHLHISLEESHRLEKSAMAQHLAEAGLDKAIARLRSQPEYSGEQNSTLGEGRFSVKVISDGSGAYRLSSTGELTDGMLVLTRQTLEAELVLSTEHAIKRFQWHVRKTR